VRNDTTGFLTIKEGTNLYRGRFSIRRGILEVSFGVRAKRARVASVPPVQVAEQLLRDLVQAEIGRPGPNDALAERVQGTY
jgi:hypothetical protein